MKGSPLLRAIVLAGLMLALAWPLYVLTQRGIETVEIAGNRPAEIVVPLDVPVELTFSRLAQKVELRHLGKVVWSKVEPALSERVGLKLPFPQEGLELGVSITWAEGAASALRIRLITPDGGELERTVWGTAMVESIVPFP
jgi:hypothetical protein